MRGHKPCQESSINGLLEDFDSISVTRSNSLRRESPPTPGPGLGQGAGRAAENGFPSCSRYSSESDPADGAALYADELLDAFHRGSPAARQNGHVPGPPSAPPRPADCRARPDAQGRATEPGELLRWEPPRAASSSPLDYAFAFPPARASKESLAYSESDWAPGLDDYERRPRSSYLTQTSPQPAMRQRSKSGSGLQEPLLPFGASAFKSHPQGHSYSSYTYPRLSEPTMCIPKVTAPVSCCLQRVSGRAQIPTAPLPFYFTDLILGKYSRTA